MVAWAAASTLAVSGCVPQAGGGLQDSDDDDDWREAVQPGVATILDEVDQLRALPVTLDPSVSVGTLPGHADVGSRGQATWTTAIEVAPGVGGMTPEFSITYDGASGNGPLGLGFSLSGTATIRRCVKTIIDDDVTQGVRWSNDDALCKGGDRLVLESGTYGLDGAGYRLAHDPTVRVIQHGDLDDPDGFFEGFEANGQIVTYGGDGANLWRGTAPEFGLPYVWSIAQRRDRFGNTIDYGYEFPTPLATGPGEIVLAEVEYAGTAVPGSRRTVSFLYEGRPDTADEWWFGAHQRSTSRLHRIDVNGPHAQLLRSYRMTYENSGDAQFSRLATLALCDAADVCLPPTRFTWGTSRTEEWSYSVPDPALVQQWPWAWVLDLDDEELISLLSSAKHTLLADLDGDLAHELILRENSSDAGGWRVWRQPTDDDPYLEDGPASVAIPSPPASPDLVDMGTWQTAIDAVVIDADGDRRSDVLVPWSPALSEYDRDPDGFFYGQGFWVSRGVNTSDVDTYEVPDPSGERTYTVVPVDHDGDLITDVWLCRGMSALDSRWVLMHGARGAGAPTSGFSFHPTNLSCSVHDELAIEPTPAGQRLLVVPAYEAGQPIDDAERLAYARLEFDLVSGVAGWHADILPRDRYQRWHDRGCRNGPAFNALGVPVYSAGLGQDKSLDVNGDGLLDVLRFELASGDELADQPEIVDDLQFTWLPPDGAWTGPHVCGSSVETPRDAVIRLWQYTGEGYIDGGVVHEFEGLAHANLALNFAGAQVVDVSDDGLSDLLLPSDGDGGSWTTLASRGDGTFVARAAHGLPADWPAYSDDQTWEDALETAGRSRTFPMFLNPRDERATLVFVGDFPDSEDLAYPVNPYSLGQHDLDGPHDNQRIVDIVDGMTRTTTFTYRQVDVSGQYDSDAPKPIGAADYQGVTRLPTGAPLWVVSTLTENAQSEPFADTERDGDLENRVTDFAYFGATLDRRGRGLLGFRTITRDDGRSTETTWFDTEYDAALDEYPSAGRPTERIATYLPADDSTREIVRTGWQYDHKASSLIGGRTLLTYASSIRTRRYSGDVGISPPVSPEDLDALVPYEDVSLSELRDPYGTTLSSIRTAQLGSTVTTTASNVVNDTTQWILGKVGRTTVRSCPHAGACKTRTTDYHYDPVTGLPSVIVIEPDSATEQLSTVISREEHGNVEAKFETPAGGIARSWVTGWDDEGVNPTSFTNPLGQLAYVVHEPGSGALVARVDVAGTTLKLRYDGFYRETFRARHATPMGVSDGAPVSTAYLPPDASWPTIPVAMRLRSTVTGGEQVTAYLDKLGRTVLRQWQGAAPIEGDLPPNLPAGTDVYQRIHYDRWGRVAEVSVPQWVGLDPIGWDSTWYDALGRVVRETAADGTIVSTRTYAHPLGLVQGTTQVFEADAAGHTTRVDYNVDGQAVHALDENGVGICMVPGAFGTTSSVWRNCEPGATGPAPVTTFTHDAYGRVLSETESAWNARTWSYDAFGNVASFHDGNGDETHYIYDGLDRIESITTVDGESTFTWDSQRVGALTSSESPDGIVRDFVYDGFGRTLEDHTRVTTSGTTVDYAFAYAWGPGDRMTQMTYPRVDGESIFTTQMVYDATGRLRAIKDAADGSLIWLLRATNPREQPKVESVRGGVDTTRTWNDRRGWLTRIDTIGASGPLQAAEYAWRPTGELDSRADAIGHTHKETFQYDAGGRLRQADLVRDGVAKPTRTVTYDAVGNILTKTGIGSYSYDTDGKLTAIGGASIFHDGDGNVVAAGTRTFDWSAIGKVRSVTDTQGTAIFRYDADGVRVERALGTTRTISIGGQRYERVRSDKTTTSVTYNIEALGRVVARVERGPTGWGFGLTSTLYGVHDDLLGSTQVLSTTTGTGIAAKTSSYDAWGRARSPSDWSAWVKDSDAAAVGVGFTGHRAALDAGLVDMRGRMYDPKFGRFLSRDRMVAQPLSPQSWNGYSYVDNRPLRFVDPSGWLPEHGDGQGGEGVSMADLCENHECWRGGDGSIARVVRVGEAAGSDSGAGAVGWRDTGMGAYGLGPDQMGGGLSSSRGWVRYGDAWFHPSGKVLRIDEVDDYRQWYANRNNTARVPGKHPFAGLIAFGRALDSAAEVTLTVTAAVNPIAGAIKAGVTLADTGVAYSKGEADEADLAMAVVDVATSGVSVVGKAATLGGRAGRQQRLREIGQDPKASSADRGWIQQEINSIERGQRTSIRNPPGKDLAHSRGREAAKGYDHVESPSNLQDRDLHRSQHKFDDFGRKNKERQ